MRKKGIVIMVAILAIIALISVYVLKWQERNTALEILAHFPDSSYDYIVTNYEIDDGKSKMIAVYKGNVVYEPYQQHEILIEDPTGKIELLEANYYEKGGKFFYDWKIRTDSDENYTWLTGKRSGRRYADLYSKEELVFNYSHTEKITGINNLVFIAEYEDTMVYVGDKETIKLPCTIHLEYYVNANKKMVTRILYDNEDYARTTEVAKLMNEGVSQKEAEERTSDSSDLHSIKMIFEILLSDEEG